jgi:hypothetical protein
MYVSQFLCENTSVKVVLVQNVIYHENCTNMLSQTLKTVAHDYVSILLPLPSGVINDSLACLEGCHHWLSICICTVWTVCVVSG